MKKIQKQLEILNTKASFFEKAKLASCLEALDQIGKLGIPYDARYITHLVFSDNELIAQKTAAIIRKLLTKKEVRAAWLNLYRSFSYCYDYDFLNKESFKKIDFFPQEEAAHLWGIASLSHSGYLREEALNCLQHLATSEVLPYVLLRLNDWVPPVRVKAKMVLSQILGSIAVTDLIQYDILIKWLEKTRRVKLKEVQNKIFSQIADPSNRENLLEAMEKAPLKRRLFCWKVLAGVVVNDQALIDKAIADPAPEVRQWAASHLCKVNHFKDRLNKLLSDSAVRVRYAALKTIPQDDFLEYKALFEAAIFDNAKSIREYARFMLRSQGDQPSVDQYRHKLLDLKEKANLGLIAGLAETGVKEDIPLIKKFIHHPNPKVRASVLTGLHRLEAYDRDHWSILSLQDSNAMVRRTGISILQSGYSHLRPELEDLLENGNPKSQKAALKVLVHYGVLDSLKNILFALTKPDAALREMAWHFLAFWYDQHARKLWFSFNNDTYEHLLKRIDTLRKTGIEPPYYASRAWHDLPNIMETLKKLR